MACDRPSEPTQRMKAAIISTQVTFLIDGFQIDIFYLFDSLRLHIYIDGHLVTDTLFQPARHTFNYLNMSELAAKSLQLYLKSHANRL